MEDALSENKTFDFNRDVLPDEFKGLLEKEKRIIEVAGADPELMKKVVMKQVEELYGAAPPKAAKENGASV